LGAEVRDSSGAVIGRVRDVRLVQDGPMQGTFGAALRLDGLVVGSSSLSSRLGYDRLGVSGPWLVAAIARRTDRSTRYVPWSEVVRLHERVIRLGCDRDELERPAELRVLRGAQQ
jgi:hypothetical protein